MKTASSARKPLRLVTAIVLLAATSAARSESAVSASIAYDPASPSNKIVLTWPTIPGKLYCIRATATLGAPWQPLAAQPLQAATNTFTYRDDPAVPYRFYQITKLDTEPPILTSTYPNGGTFAVSTQAVLLATLWDETGIDPSSIRLSIAGQPALSLPEPHLVFTNNVLTYTPGHGEALGAPGDIVTATIALTDTLGYATTNLTWAFQLELPTVINDNILFINQTGPKSVQTPTQPHLALLSTDGDLFTYTFAGSSSGLTNGLHLIDTNATGGYTRTVVNFTEYPANNTVVVLTRPALLAELLVSGSLNAASNFVARQSADQTQTPKSLTWEPESSLKFETQLDLARTLYSNDTLTVRVDQGSQLAFGVTLDITANIKDSTLTDFEAAITGNANLDLTLVANAASSCQMEETVPLITPIHNFHFAFIGPIPIWVETILGFDLGFTADLAGSAQVTAGFAASKSIRLSKRYTPETGWTSVWDNPGASFQWLGPTWQIAGSANLHAFVQPKLEMLLCSVAGVEANLEPYLEFIGNYQLSPYHWDVALYAGLDANLGLDLSVWDANWGSLPTATFSLVPRTQIWQRDSSTEPPQITGQPTNRTVLAGNTAIFTVQAKGAAPLSYQWWRNAVSLSDGTRIAGSRSATLTISGVKWSDAGNYQVLVGNSAGTVWSQLCTLDVTNNPSPVDMVLIPAGSFTMGNCVNSGEGNLDELPLHTVYLSAFYIDKYEVTKALWDEVYQWAITQGYSFTSGASGKAVNHPAQTMTWYDAVKWCNARSEMEGRIPAYYMNAAQTTVYRSGQTVVQNARVKWDKGYRLPTEAEWEKAARGPASGHRFPWVDVETITHNRANYFSSTAYTYDKSTTSGYHPTFNDGSKPYTSPAASFAPNGYALYDMAGNVWEWCWDWYDSYSSGSQSDPRGPATGSLRVKRGGGWDDNIGAARYCRVAVRYGYRPDTCYNFIGFRTVLPPPQ